MAIPITEIKGIGPQTARALAEQGYNTAEDLAAAQPSDLTTIPGFGAVRANFVIEAAKTLTGEILESTASGKVIPPATDSDLEPEPQKQKPDHPKKKSTKKKKKIKKEKEEKAKKSKKDKDKKKDKKRK